MRRAYLFTTIAMLSAAVATLTAVNLTKVPQAAAMPATAEQTEVSADGLAQLANRAIEPQSAEAAVAELRALGPRGLNALFEAHRLAIDEATTSELKLDGERLERWQRIRNAIDGVSGQRDCRGLYWYTDFEEAQAAAKLAGKPILSLRMLGNLTDEFSCANSRFFRSTLYSNQEVAKLLGERFVLHWQSVRPVPIVTIDFGDGRTLRRTVTGNSAHYMLTADGLPVEAIPGLYGPQAFMGLLTKAGELAMKVTAASGESERVRLIAEFHRQRGEALDRAWQRDMAQLSDTQAAAAATTEDTAAIASSPTEASEGIWNRVAVLHASSAQLDEASRKLIESQHPTAVATMEVAVTKAMVERPLARLVRGLQDSIALDTVRNEYLLHRRIHDWFADGVVGELPAFNERVYAELFQTPSSDPWLGLLPQGYTALENNGVVAANP